MPFLRVILLISTFASPVFADSFVCDLSPNGKRPPLFDKVELWLDADNWQGQMRDAVSKSLSANPVQSNVRSIGPGKWEFSGILYRTNVGDRALVDYKYRYSLNTNTSAVTLGGTFIGQNVHIVETGARGPCRKTG